jgi:glycosyltransferase involved in cell wall biosynthesis
MSPAVSVVIATFNRGDYLGATLDSVFAQTFSNFEVIVVDDGSTDDTRRVVAGYGAQVRYLYQKNSGPSAARNLGVRHANADWISIQDSDDLCLTNHLDVLHGYVTSHPEVGMVFANGTYLGGPVHNRETIIPESKSCRLARRPVKLQDIFDKSIVRLQASLIAKKSYDQIGGHNEGLWICMDLDLAFRLWARYPLAYLDAPVFSYRKHNANISSDQERRLSENIRVIEYLLRDFPQAEEILGRRRVHARLAYRYYRLAKTQMKKGKAAEARESLRSAVGLSSLNPKYRLYQLQWMALNPRS